MSSSYLQHPPRNGGIGMPINSLPLSLMQIDTTGEREENGLRRTEIPEGRRIFRNRRRSLARSSQSDGLAPSAWAAAGRRREEGAKLKDAPTDTEYGPRSSDRRAERRTQVNRNRKAKRSRRRRRKPKSYHMKQAIGCYSPR